MSFSRYHNAVVNSAIRQIWLKIAEKWHQTRRPAVSEKVAEMMEYLRSNLHRPTTRIDLAREFYYTPEHINYLFKKELGISPSGFLNRERAIKLLCEEGCSFQQAALATGISNQYYFSRVFKNIFGYLPSRIKKYLIKDIEDIYEKHLTTSESVVT